MKRIIDIIALIGDLLLPIGAIGTGIALIVGGATGTLWY